MTLDMILSKLNSENNKLRALLFKYGNHTTACPYDPDMHEPASCTCGWNEAVLSPPLSVMADDDEETPS
jgi:hypothetical protein